MTPKITAKMIASTQIKVAGRLAFRSSISGLAVTLACRLGPFRERVLFIQTAAVASRSIGQQWREVKISLTGWTLADAMGELRKWLDHHNCVPVNFDIERGNRRVLVVRILFADDTMADMFERDFGGR
jgi:hypothetical protein